jgi:hypothetical protein
MKLGNIAAISDEETSGLKLTNKCCIVTVNQASDRDAEKAFWDSIRPNNYRETEE